MRVAGDSLINGFYQRSLTKREILQRPHPGTAADMCQCAECYKWAASLSWVASDSVLKPIPAVNLQDAAYDQLTELLRLRGEHPERCCCVSCDRLRRVMEILTGEPFGLRRTMTAGATK
jgi:uncharacterized Fe-S cluster-containing radical SAM superfamily protein